MEEKIIEIKDLLHAKRFSELKEYLKEINSVDISSFFEELKGEEIIIMYRLLDKEKAAEVFTELDSDIQEKLIKVLTDKELKDVVNELYLDDAVDIIEEMPSNVVKRILKHIEPEDRKTINKLLKYPEDTAGSMMTTEFIDLKENMTVEEALAKIKKIGVDSETVYNCYVLSATRKIVGVITLEKLLLSNLDTKISDIMDQSIIKISTTEDQENVANMFDKYDEYALPVVDKEDRLVGIITVDDALDILKEEQEEDFEKMAAILPSEDPYLKTSVFTHIKNRIGWLLILMLSATITGTILAKYEAAFEAVPLLVSFIPMVMGTAGNSGQQTSTIVIRALATGEITLKDWLKVLWKEIRVGTLVGLVLFVVNIVRIYIQYQDIQMALVLGLTLIFTVIVSKSIGCLLPILVKKIKKDPAVVAAPLLTTVIDLCAIVIYFQIATSILTGIKGV
ncbi:MAG: magnesium transporter [Clostridia bacterium]|nr:magnesium transporter [Clostridia bacterium]